jgi:hypothetical protein
MIKALAETPIGRALLAYWEDLPLWTLANVILLLTLLPGFVAWSVSGPRLAILLSWPVSFAMSGIVNALARSVHQKAPAYRDLLTGPYAVALSTWVISAVLALVFTLPLSRIVFIGCCLAACCFLLVAPFSLCISALYSSGGYLAWRNGFVMAVHAPLIAVGLVALAGLLGWVSILSKGALLVVVPALWMAITMYTTREVSCRFE